MDLTSQILDIYDAWAVLPVFREAVRVRGRWLNSARRAVGVHDAVLCGVERALVVAWATKLGPPPRHAEKLRIDLVDGGGGILESEFLGTDMLPQFATSPPDIVLETPVHPAPPPAVHAPPPPAPTWAAPPPPPAEVGRPASSPAGADRSADYWQARAVSAEQRIVELSAQLAVMEGRYHQLVGQIMADGTAREGRASHQLTIALDHVGRLAHAGRTMADRAFSAMESAAVRAEEQAAQAIREANARAEMAREAEKSAREAEISAKIEKLVSTLGTKTDGEAEESDGLRMVLDTLAPFIPDVLQIWKGQPGPGALTSLLSALSSGDARAVDAIRKGVAKLTDDQRAQLGAVLMGIFSVDV